MKKHSEEFVELFCKVWNESDSIDHAAEVLGLGRERTRGLAGIMRRRGMYLKKYKPIAIQNAKRIKDPTPEEIKFRAEEIRKGWQKKTESDQNGEMD